MLKGIPKLLENNPNQVQNPCRPRTIFFRNGIGTSDLATGFETLFKRAESPTDNQVRRKYAESTPKVRRKFAESSPDPAIPTSDENKLITDVKDTMAKKGFLLKELKFVGAGKFFPDAFQYKSKIGNKICFILGFKDGARFRLSVWGVDTVRELEADIAFVVAVGESE